ncbi:hypothetical protein SDC9_107075 [bioreactor metagenome]|uniref:Uncharacterized protein n=1 Tax=bioreactor metagenome TaxID=1076179 RepID=A0A645BET5_9ZZZZ
MESAHLVLQRILGAEDDQRRIDPGLADFLDHGEAVDQRQHDVDDAKIEGLGMRQIQPGHAVGGVDRGVSGFLERLQQKIRCLFIVFDYQYLHKSEPSLRLPIRSGPNSPNLRRIPPCRSALPLFPASGMP